MNVTIIGAWKNDKTQQSFSIKTHRALCAHLLSFLSQSNRKPKTSAQVYLAYQPFFSRIAIDLFLQNKLKLVQCFLPTALYDKQLQVQDALEKDKATIELMNAKFAHISSILGDDAHVYLMKMLNQHPEAMSCWCSGGILDTCRMAQYRADLLICYSWSNQEDLPDEECLPEWNYLPIKKKVNIPLQQIIDSENQITIVTKKRTKSKKTT